jgi:hypothetical protein
MCRDFLIFSESVMLILLLEGSFEGLASEYTAPIKKNITNCITQIICRLGKYLDKV